jgi:hypothetical protein
MGIPVPLRPKKREIYQVLYIQVLNSEFSYDKPTRPLPWVTLKAKIK